MTGSASAAVSPCGLRCAHLAEPLGIDEPRPLLSWRLAGHGEPTGYRVRVWADDEVWDTGEVADPDAVSVRYAGPPLRPRTRYGWQVSVAGATAESWFETAGPEWTASWIAVPSEVDVVDAPEEGETALADHGLAPAAELRRVFDAETPARARIYATARGLYRLRLNGEQVGDVELTPGWTDYTQRIDYQTYDVTAQVTVGANVLTATLADGWWSGYVGFDPRRAGAHYGSTPSLLVELHLDYADGRHEVVGTDERWQARRSRIRYADLLMGECHDHTAAPREWRPAVVTGTDHELLTAAVAPPVRAVAELPARSVTRLGARRHLVDFGQNLAGRVRLSARGLAHGDRVVIRHGEALAGDGGLYTENLRTAAATDVLISGDDTTTFEPHATYHGFRYAEVTGPETLAAAEATAVVLHNDITWAGDFACSDPDVTRLHENIRWGLRGNVVSVPTDCPQRDERLGWLADAQVFLPTACYHADVAAFFAGWLREVRGAQSAEGCFPNVAPTLAGVADEGAPGWGDAGVLVPWHLYRVYGDERVLADNLDAMCAWVDYVHRHNPELVWRDKVGPHFADWLAPVPTPRELVATAYFARSAELTARAAGVLGDTERERRYGELAGHIRKVFVERFWAPDSQTGYLLALAFELLPEELVPVAVDRLVALVRAAGPAVTTGFLGVGLIAPVLDAHGHADLAHALLRRRDAPSWLYPLRHGATTVWERWTGYTDEAGFAAAAMNSFNHYALGSIGQWLYEGVAGIAQAPDSVGYRDLVIRPRPGDLVWARASYESVRGTISSAWHRSGDDFTLDLTVPPGTTATVHVPGEPDAVRVTSGDHQFTSRLEEET
jgi:alpha-L-rhamnosidase